MKMLGYYRKKPVTVQAWQIAIDEHAPEWVWEALHSGVILPTGRGPRWGSDSCEVMWASAAPFVESPDV